MEDGEDSGKAGCNVYGGFVFVFGVFGGAVEVLAEKGVEDVLDGGAAEEDGGRAEGQGRGSRREGRKGGGQRVDVVRSVRRLRRRG